MMPDGSKAIADRIVISAYESQGQREWDQFVRDSRNGTFLFCRDYMDYHRHRFEDCSLVCRCDSGNILALLPANQTEEVVVSHGGLTYGGFVVGARMNTETMRGVCDRSLEYLRARGFRKLVYKTVPHIYHRAPAEDDLHALFALGARLYRRDVTTTAPGGAVRLQERRSRSIRKAARLGITWRECDLFEQFWEILSWNLKTVHDLEPVHSIDEIRLLKTRFPTEIRLFGAFVHERLVAGTVIYETETVAHAQYTASAPEARECGALDLLIHALVSDVYASRKYFDFGVSTESDGRWLNSGLVAFKEGFGGRTVVHDFYELDI